MKKYESGDMKNEFKDELKEIQEDWRERVSKELVDEFHYICED